LAETGEEKYGLALEAQIVAMKDRLRYFLKKTFRLSDIDLDDLTQDTLMAAVQAVRREDFHLETGTTLSTFVHAIAKHKALDFIKSRQVRQHPSIDDVKRPLPVARDPDPDLSVQDLIERVAAIIENLPEVEGHILYLIYFRGYSVSAVAEELHLPATRVSTIKFAAMHKVRQRCEKEGLMQAAMAVLVLWNFWRVIYGL
jgi:RNA polymerase sigma factor (sigma-70 family)